MRSPCPGSNYALAPFVTALPDVMKRAGGSAGMHAWDALDMMFEIWQPVKAGQQPMSPTAQAVILARRAIAQQQAQQLTQVCALTRL